ncbi:M23 family metallopeptidase [Streptomyces sp. NPDC001635]
MVLSALVFLSVLTSGGSEEHANGVASGDSTTEQRSRYVPIAACPARANGIVLCGTPVGQTAVRARAGGVVVRISTDAARGRHQVVIRRAAGPLRRYGNMTSLFVTVGERVRAGEQIGVRPLVRPSHVPTGVTQVIP